jgi:hypothetical protein
MRFGPEGGDLSRWRQEALQMHVRCFGIRDEERRN